MFLIMILYRYSSSDWTCQWTKSCLCGSGCADSRYFHHTKENEKQECQHSTTTFNLHKWFANIYVLTIVIWMSTLYYTE